jgi:DMSO reductase family type II enzyme heme b subunit
MHASKLVSPVLAVLAVVTAACRPEPPPPSPAEVVAIRRATLPTAPADAAWNETRVFAAPLLLQDMVEPRLLTPSTPEVRVRAITDGSKVAFLLEWADETEDGLPGISRFSDACAVQLPARVQPDVPAPQMGESGKPVEVTYWRAFWQSAVNGRDDSIEALYPGASVDHYPFEAAALDPGSAAQREMAQRYAPARSLGNRMAGPRERPVEDLIAEGPGTLRPGAKPQSEGRGERTDTGWAVVLSRPLPAGLAPGVRSQVAFAVWQGAAQEAGGRKMRSAWVPIVVEGAR